MKPIFLLLVVMLTLGNYAQQSRQNGIHVVSANGIEDIFLGTFKGQMPVNPGAANEDARKPRTLVTTYKKDGDWFVCEARIINATGEDRPFYSYRAKFDGNEYPFISHPNNRLVLKRLNRLAWMQTESKEGRMIAHYTEIFSDDGKTLTVVNRHIADDGKENTNILIRERQ